MTILSTTCNAPGKLILSGEHSVVYGMPALSMAINLSTNCHLTQIHQEAQALPVFEIDLPDYQQHHLFPFPVWRDRAIQIEAKYKSFKDGVISIETVLQQPVDLIICILYHFNQIHNIQLRHWQLSLTSHGLIGKGIGSSGSVIISVLQSLYHHHHRPQDKTELFEIAQLIECRQHGHASGLDTTTILQGGVLQFRKGQTLQHLSPRPFSAWLIDTGTPISNTGQVVMHVKKWAQKNAPNHHAHLHPIWQEFSTVTQQILEAWQSDDQQKLLQAIRHNQSLLEQIGVIPDKVKQYLQKINQQPGCAAKVCGAGSLTGGTAGMVLLICNQPPETLCGSYPYYPLSINELGSQCEIN